VLRYGAETVTVNVLEVLCPT